VVDGDSSGRYSNSSPGWQSSSRHSLVSGSGRPVEQAVTRAATVMLANMHDARQIIFGSLYSQPTVTSSDMRRALTVSA
jgi:hypothetical protein